MVDDETIGKVVNISKNHAADVLKSATTYLQNMLDVYANTEAGADEVIGGWQKSISYLRELAAKMVDQP